MTTLVVSPHLDDAVLSYGAHIARIDHVTVATIFAGIPPAWSWPTPFDNASGFTDSVEAVKARRLEDRAAARELHATVRHLPHLDGQYGIANDGPRVAADLLGWIRRSERVVVPLGLAHPDHHLVANLCRRALAALPPRPFTVYADLPSAKLWPSHVPGALRGWERAGFALTECEPICGGYVVKERAVEKYVSQTRFPELAWENLTEERAWTATSSAS